MNDKNNSKFEFPNLLDLKEYSCKQHLGEKEEEEVKKLMEVDDQDYIYRLVGVNIHVGTADHGHYYSFINTKRGEEEPDPNSEEWKKVENNEWMRFDDSTVSTLRFSTEM